MNPMATGDAATSSLKTSIYYFGYGPTVNPIVRKRRNINTCEEKAAVLPEFRMTFAYGGIANMINQRGYEVHGVLMKFATEDDWTQFQQYDAGYNDSDLVKVIPYDADDDDEPITAYAMSMKEYDESKLEAPIEQLPTERYLKLIANGMREYNVDEDYVQDQIMSVPYVPSCKPEEYQRVPQDSENLPRITFSRYERLCQRTSDIYFVLNNKVCRLGPHDSEHPAAVWIRERLHGKHDATLIIHQTIVEPDLPMVNTLEELTPRHHAWAENHTMEYLQKCNIAATKVYDLVSDDNLGKRGIMTILFRCFGRKNKCTENPAQEPDNVVRRNSNPRPQHDNFVSSELMQREIRRNIADGGDTDDNSSCQ